MANFGIANSSNSLPLGIQVAVATAFHTLIGVAASTGGSVATHSNPASLRRGKLYDILIGTNGTPADNYMEFDVARASISSTSVYVGAASSVSSAFMLDTADAGFSSLVFINSSNESGITSSAEAFYVGINQRASYRWVAAPGSEIVWPALSTASAASVNGLVLRTRSGGYTGTATGNVLAQEQ